MPNLELLMLSLNCDTEQDLLMCSYKAGYDDVARRER